MGCIISGPFNHPDLLVTFACSPVATGGQEWYRCHSSGCCIGQKYGCFGFSCCNTTDPGWVRNSPLRIELVDLLTDALKAMEGWPSLSGCFGQYLCEHVPPQLVLELNKVCKKFNDAKLFDMGLQCRAIISLGAEKRSYLLVLVEKKSEYKLLDLGDTLEHIRRLEKGQKQVQNQHGRDMKAALAWSPPEDWMTRLSPPYNEATNHV
jgi:hypothetical protein